MLKVAEFLYNAGIRIYGILIHLSALKNKKAREFIYGRKNQVPIAEKVSVNLKYIWVHCSSLGEFEQGRSLIDHLSKEFPHYRIVITFFSPSGYEIRKDYPAASHVQYLLLDYPDNAKKFIDALEPTIAIFIKYEFWYNYLNYLNKKNIPTYLVSAVFRENQVFFKKTGFLHRRMLSFFTHIFVQDKASASLLDSVGKRNYSVIPDTRIDRVLEIAGNKKLIPEAEKFSRGKTVIIGGSTYETEENYLKKLLSSGKGKIKVILAPHQVGKLNIRRIARLFSEFKVVLWSEKNEGDLEKADVFLIDTIGLLSSLYQYADIAFIGGGFGKSIHNILEPATFGIPILFGPANGKFPEAAHLKDRGAGFEVANEAEFIRVSKLLIDDLKAREKAGKASRNFIEENSGGTEKVLERISVHLKNG